MELFGSERKNIWQVAAGDTNRNYVQTFVDWDVILNGPGDAGPWPGCVDELKNSWSSKKITDLKRFCEEIEDGDIIVLRVGTRDVYGVGLVVGGYDHNEEFGDIDGWDLQHVRRVRWIWRYDKDSEGSEPKPKEFKTYDMKFGDTVQLMTSNEILDWIKSLVITDGKLNREIAKLPTSIKTNEFELLNSVSDFLFDQGVASDSINKLMGQLGELTRIGKWYWRAQTPASESETISYLVIPLLRTLGWTPQKMAIEWNNVDIAIFNNSTRINKNLSIVVEAKKKDRSCLTAVSQARDYAEKHGGDQCKRLIVTDGIKYGIYLADENGKFKDYPPNAYLNLVRLRESYPIYESKGAKEALLYMSPDWKP